MRRPIKVHLVNRSNQPVNRSNRETTFKPSDFLIKTPVTGQTGPVNRSVYRSEPVTHVLLNLDLNSTGSYRYTGRFDRFEFKSKFKIACVTG